MNLRADIEAAAAAYVIDPDLVHAVVLVESNGDPWAFNPEPRYRWLWNVRKNTPFRSLTDAERISEIPPNDFPCLAGDRDQEWWSQQASWGLMQVMGAVAREHGYRAPYLTQLCDPLVNLDLGCKHLAGLLEWAKGRNKRALEAYNGGIGGVGSAQTELYASKVTYQLDSLRKARA